MIKWFIIKHFDDIFQKDPNFDAFFCFGEKIFGNFWKKVDYQKINWLFIWFFFIFKYLIFSSGFGWSESEILTKLVHFCHNKNFNHQSNFCENRKFDEKSKIWWKIEILVKNRNISQKSKIRTKSENLRPNLLQKCHSILLKITHSKKYASAVMVHFNK